jgi:hypothetical protein
MELPALSLWALNSELVRDGGEGHDRIGLQIRFRYPSSVPSAALMMTDEMVFSGMYVTDATRLQ